MNGDSGEDGREGWEGRMVGWGGRMETNDGRGEGGSSSSGNSKPFERRFHESIGLTQPHFRVH